MDLFSKEIEQELSKLFKEIAKEIGNEIGQKCLDSLQNQYQKIWKPFENQINALLENLNENIRKHDNINQSIIQGKENLLKNLENFKLQAQESIHISLEKFEKTLLQNLNQAVYQKMSDVVQKNIETIASQLCQLIADLRKTLLSFQESSKTCLDDIATKCDQKLENTLKSMQREIEDVCVQIEGMIKRSEEASISSLSMVEKTFLDLNLKVTEKLEQWDTKWKELDIFARDSIKKLTSDSRNLLQKWDIENRQCIQNMEIHARSVMLELKKTNEETNQSSLKKVENKIADCNAAVEQTLEQWNIKSKELDTFTRDSIQKFDLNNHEMIQKWDKENYECMQKLKEEHKIFLLTTQESTEKIWKEASDKVEKDMEKFFSEISQSLQTLKGFQSSLEENLKQHFSSQQNDIVRLEKQLKEQQNCLASSHTKIKVLIFSNIFIMAGVIAILVTLFMPQIEKLLNLK
ncbi:MAG: hypothetical protein HUU50_17580 [Candidatus Brocadiae bacterium]|nr:hypothetical protein [Candidatus Brocadiia bacterium]